MKYSELRELNCIFDGIEFTPIYKIDNYIPIKDDQGNTIDFELDGFKLIKTAEQNYKNSIKVVSKEKTETEILKQQLLETQSLVAELRYKSILKENGGM
ncbi:hypothetical protein [Clostridium weizhouense]|uniref:Uncharacterized protein n=1 Tax=Clostridium weizhouense TaxID=2859781 RepID=A0ABS7AIH9_9CLOT|nr:hypothetical protein [Clostridium weizhouense]MBW6408468.1 hypothetical protein [Clostridium weizhouense]